MIFPQIAGIAISAFFIVFIFSKKKRRMADILLSLINLSVIALLVISAILQKALTPLDFMLVNIIPVYIYPLFLIYALEILQVKIHHRGRWVLLFLPALISSAYIGSDLFIFHHYDQARLERLYNFPTPAYHLVCKGFPIIFLGAFIWLIKQVKVYGANIKDRYSFIDPIELNWLTSLAWINIFITVISLLGFIISQFQIFPISSRTVCSVMGILIGFAVFYASFHGIRQYTIADYYGDKTAVTSTTPEILDAGAAVKYKTSTLSDAEQQRIFEKTARLFEEKKLYLEPKLQLSDVAELLNVSTYSLSQTINTIAGKPFYDFVNSYRVRHLQTFLEDPSQQHFTILSMGFESGFNSKASLNRVFRQETGLSPSEYLERHQLKRVSS